MTVPPKYSLAAGASDGLRRTGVTGIPGTGDECLSATGGGEYLEARLRGLPDDGDRLASSFGSRGGPVDPNVDAASMLIFLGKLVLRLWWLMVEFV
jgi:hypothetical protein